MFGIKSKPNEKNKKHKTPTPMSTEAKKRQQAAIASYYAKKRQESNKTK